MTIVRMAEPLVRAFQRTTPDTTASCSSAVNSVDIWMADGKIKPRGSLDRSRVDTNEGSKPFWSWPAKSQPTTVRSAARTRTSLVMFLSIAGVFQASRTFLLMRNLFCALCILGSLVKQDVDRFAAVVREGRVGSIAELNNMDQPEYLQHDERLDDQQRFGVVRNVLVALPDVVDPDQRPLSARWKVVDQNALLFGKCHATPRSLGLACCFGARSGP